MKSQSRLGRMLLSPLMGWIAVLSLGSYLMVSFDKKILNQPLDDQSLTARLKRYIDAAHFTYIKKGIDLEGGTYLVLSVDVEKAIENKLSLEARSIDGLLRSKDAEVPSKKIVVPQGIDLVFDSPAAASAAISVLQEARLGSIKFKLAESVIQLSLSADLEQSIKTGAVEQGVNVLTNRLGGYGVEGIVVQQHGDRQIVIQMPGVDDAEHIKSVITKTALLEFKIVEEVASSREALLDRYDGDLPGDKMIVPGERADAGQQLFYLVSTFADLTGDRISAAAVDHDEFNRPNVTFKLDSIGAREFAELTANNIGKSLGIIIDNVMKSAPSIRTEINGGSASITGNYTQKEAFDLALVLRSGSLQAPLKLENENRVGASLGQDSINKGAMSCVVALAMLFVFSLLYYRIPGLLAVIALMVNILLTLLMLSYFKATLTLPGIAGIVLTIGMAIDASILIYERVKDELLVGIPFRKALMDGFKSAMPVIMDSNITTFLTGLVLYWFGGPAIKGFAITIMLGIIATVLSGVYFLKHLYRFIFDNTSISGFKL